MATTLTNKKIKDLTLTSILNDTDDLIIEDSTPKTKRVRVSTLRNKLTSWTYSVLKTSSKTLTGAINELKTNFDDRFLIYDTTSKGTGSDFLNFENKAGYTLLAVYNSGLNYNNVLVTGIMFDVSTNTYRVRFNTTQTADMNMRLRFVWIKGESKTI